MLLKACIDELCIINVNVNDWNQKQMRKKNPVLFREQDLMENTRLKNRLKQPKNIVKIGNSRIRFNVG